MSSNGSRMGLMKNLETVTILFLVAVAISLIFLKQSFDSIDTYPGHGTTKITDAYKTHHPMKFSFSCWPEYEQNFCTGGDLEATFDAKDVVAYLQQYLIKVKDDVVNKKNLFNRTTNPMFFLTLRREILFNMMDRYQFMQYANASFSMNSLQNIYMDILSLLDQINYQLFDNKNATFFMAKMHDVHISKSGGAAVAATLKQIGLTRTGGNLGCRHIFGGIPEGFVQPKCDCDGMYEILQNDNFDVCTLETPNIDNGICSNMRNLIVVREPIEHITSYLHMKIFYGFNHIQCIKDDSLYSCGKHKDSLASLVENVFNFVEIYRNNLTNQEQDKIKETFVDSKNFFRLPRITGTAGSMHIDWDTSHSRFGFSLKMPSKPSARNHKINLIESMQNYYAWMNNLAVRWLGKSNMQTHWITDLDRQPYNNNISNVIFSSAQTLNVHQNTLLEKSKRLLMATDYVLPQKIHSFSFLLNDTDQMKSHLSQSWDLTLEQLIHYRNLIKSNELAKDKIAWQHVESKKYQLTTESIFENFTPDDIVFLRDRNMLDNDLFVFVVQIAKADNIFYLYRKYDH